MNTINHNYDALLQNSNNRNQEPVMEPILGSQINFSDNDDNQKGETKRDPAQKPNTGDWGDESEWEETDEREKNLGNDNSGGAGSSGSASTNS